MSKEREALQHLLSSSTFTNMSFMNNIHTDEPHVHGPSCNHGHDHEEDTTKHPAQSGQAGTIGE